MATTELDMPPAPTGPPRWNGRAVAAWTAAAAIALSPWGITFIKERAASFPAAPSDPTAGDNGGRPHARHPAFSPDGKRIVFTVSGAGGSYLYVAGVDGMDMRRVAKNVGWPSASAFTPDGKHLLYVTQDEITRDEQTDEDPNPDMHIRRVGTDGKGMKRLARLESYNELGGTVAFSPDGRKVAYVHRTIVECEPTAEEFCRDDQDLYVMNVDGTGRRQIVDLPGGAFGPSFSADSRQLVFTSQVGKDSAIFVVGADGKGLRQVSQRPHHPEQPVFGPGDSSIAYSEYFYDPTDGYSEPRAMGLDGSAGDFTTLPRPEARPAPDWSRFIWVEGPDEMEDVYIQDAGSTVSGRLASSPPASGRLASSPPAVRRATDLRYEPAFFGKANARDLG